MRSWLAALLVVTACGGGSTPPPLPEVVDPLPLVDPTIGTGGMGFAYASCFVGAVVPGGLAKPAPDTNGPYGTVGFLHFSGYHADDDRIQGFSQLHLHGAGLADYGVLSLMPVPAFDPGKTSVAQYEARFAKVDEQARAGSYRVKLATGIDVALSATAHVAVHRYTMPAGGAVLIDLAKVLSGGEITAATITVDDAAQEVTGQLHHKGAMSGSYGGYDLYFVLRTESPWTAHQVWSQAAPPSGAASAQGVGVGAALMVPAGTFEAAIGLSLVSLAGARGNLRAEVPTMAFGDIQAMAEAAWRDALGVVKLTGGTEAQRRIFYTSLYHALLMPSVIADVDGSYQLHGQPVTTATGYVQQSDLSLWDTYRTVASLYAWLAPARARDQACSLLGFARGLGAFPKWPIAVGESGTMLGASAEIVVADAVARGVDGCGADAWPILAAAAMDQAAPAGGRGGRDQVEAYMTHGYVPRDGGGPSVSKTTEFAHDDFALAQLAAALGHTAEHDALVTRSHGWRQLLDPAVGFLRGKNADGTFPTTAYDPKAMSDDYDEANGWQSLWMAGLHDPEGLAMIFGGADAAVAKLTMFFELARADWEAGDPAAVNFPRPYYWHGNEPDLNAVFLFAQLGHPELTARWLRWILDTQYGDLPDGVAGNDDGGTLGSWYVLATLGVYPIAGSDRFVLGAPRFPSARVTVGGHELVILGDGVSDANAQVVRIEVDGQPWTSPEITQGDLAKASTLRFVMGP